MNVTLYSTDCPRCKVLEAKLIEKNVEYIVNKNQDEMERLGMMSAPALMVDGDLMMFAEAVKWVGDYEELPELHCVGCQVKGNI